ncbi:hypothetical protein TanjilG_04481 [Lupinus angustifolius]|uniref:Uncharacterized protein n=1 Tax=Lupinus angustifolius TaxID=3871 RepID=A0A4P1RQM8_LUPAN|nr:hypothetical protein TanjilG_04481 [Lupinus angustifolius]
MRRLDEEHDLFAMVYSMLQGKRDVETVLTMGIMEDVSIIAQPAGDPAGARLKPGNGPGSGFGIRVDSPLGPFRLEYAFNDKKHKRSVNATTSGLTLGGLGPTKYNKD